MPKIAVAPPKVPPVLAITVARKPRTLSFLFSVRLGWGSTVSARGTMKCTVKITARPQKPAEMPSFQLNGAAPSTSTAMPRASTTMASEPGRNSASSALRAAFLPFCVIASSS